VYLFFHTVRAGQVEVVRDAVEGFLDDALKHLVDEEQDVLGPRTLDVDHKLLVVTETADMKLFNIDFFYLLSAWNDVRWSEKCRKAC